MTPHSPRVFLVVDPVQDYEETLTILGVHGSLPAARLAVYRYRRLVTAPTAPTGLPWPLITPDRDVEVQLWHGDQHLDTWTHHGDENSRRAGTWTHTAGPGAPTPPPTERHLP